MTEQPDDAVEALFDRAAALPPEDRAAFLDAACRGDPGLRAELDSLLAHDRGPLHSDGLLKSPLRRGPEGSANQPTPNLVAATPKVHATGGSPAEGAAFADTSMSAPPPSTLEIPGYLILGRLGAGGMGLVYKAKHLRLERIVALKVIRSGAQASAAELARFRTEAQAAARLQHPNIVQVFEVGEANGQPFLCMEHVEGVSLAERLKGTPWPGAQAAELVETLARAMEAAHRQGIVHRDLKPGNILLSAVGDRPAGIGQASPAGPTADRPQPAAVPKITDFGLAKMLASNQGQTETGAFLGSPSYAAPEQAGAHKNAIGAHTDIYALGAILYELLTGRPPFTGATLLETIRQLLYREPVPPRLLSSSIPPDLEAICLKCLEKNPSRRYGRAAELAEDLRRWQHHEPTLARSPGAFGRAARWCRRHPTLTAITAVIVLGVLGMTWQWRAAVTAGDLAEERRQAAEKARLDADRARQDAVEDAAVAREIANFLGGLFEEADPYVPTGRVFGEQPNLNPSALDIINRGARKLANAETFKKKLLVRAALLDKVGNVYISLGEGAKAAPFALEALELRRQHLPAVHAELAASLHSVAFLHLTKGNYKKSKELFAAALDMRTRLFGARSRLAMTSRYHLAVAKVALADPSAEPLLLEALEFQRARLKAALEQQSEAVGQVAMELGITLLTLCNCYSARNQGIKALPYLLEAQQVVQKIANKEIAALAGHFLGYRRCQALGLVDKAEKELRLALDAVEKWSGKHHYIYAALQRELAYLYFDNRRFEDAEKVFLDLEANHRKMIGDDGAALADLSYEIARSIQRGRLVTAGQANDCAGQREQATRVEQYARAAYLQGERNGAEEHRIAIYAVFLAHTLLYSKPEPDNAAAEEIAREAVRLRNDLNGVGHELTSHPLAYLFLALARQNKVEAIEKTMLDLLARNPRPKWDHNAGDALPEAARKLALAGKTRTALLVLEQVARAGHYNLDRVRSDPAFASLRESEDYRQLLRKLSK